MGRRVGVIATPSLHLKCQVVWELGLEEEGEDEDEEEEEEGMK